MSMPVCAKEVNGIGTAFEISFTLSDGKAIVTKITGNGDAIIPETVLFQSKTYKVVEIADNACKNQKIAKVTIPKNVTKIGKNAFNGCTKLKTITIKSTKLKSIGKDAFKKIHKKAVVKVPTNKYNKYSKLLKNMKIKKI